MIDGKWVEALSGKTFETVNPATGEVLARVAEADADDVDRAVKAARAAFERGWGESNPFHRTRLLLKIADLIEEHNDELAQLETLDNGKPIFESGNIDVPGAAETFRYYAGWADQDLRRDQSQRPGVLQLHAARAGRRLRPDHPVELPAADGGVEDRAGARVRQHRRAEARRADAAHRAPSRRAAARRRACRRAS